MGPAGERVRYSVSFGGYIYIYTTPGQPGGASSIREALPIFPGSYYEATLLQSIFLAVIKQRVVFETPGGLGFFLLENAWWLRNGVP